MLAATALALLAANSPLSSSYHALISTAVVHGMDVGAVIKDVLMTLFFFTVGLELKREMREGALSAPGQKLLPLIAAAGGILLPALIYLFLTRGDPLLRAGWAIPTATDIAFALCVLRLAGSRVPQAAVMFLLAVAIYDDLAAILIIAFAYSSGIALLPLLSIAAICAVLYLFNRLHVCHYPPYLALGILLWFAVHYAGIHPTVAGVITALAIPMRGHGEQPMLAPLLHRLHPWVAFGVLPLFAFSAAGVDLRGIAFADAFAPLPLGIAAALFLGKQLGIFTATFAAVKLRLAPLPAGMVWGQLYGVAILAGIGFTMSLFLGALAFPAPEMLDSVKVGVLAGSLISAVFGIIFLRVRRTS